MEARQVVVVGGSAGGIEAAVTLCRGLPADLDAAVLICIHISPSSPSALPELIARKSLLRVKHPLDGERIETGSIYVAPPNLHLLIEDGHIRLGRGPRENGHRPAIDPLFRTAAESFGARALGVILSGNLDDGAAGLSLLRRNGGGAIVQDPRDAVFTGMPANAIEWAGADEILAVAEIAAAITARVGRLGVTSIRPKSLRSSSTGEHAMNRDERVSGDVSDFGCPSCGGVLWQTEDRGVAHYRCRVGHAFSDESLLDAQVEGIERAMWTALRALEESVQQALRLVKRMEVRGHENLAERFRMQAADAEARAATVRRALLRLDEGGADMAG